jgi:hypothetical protein
LGAISEGGVKEKHLVRGNVSLQRLTRLRRL